MTEQDLIEKFTDAVGRADPNELCPWAPFTTDHERSKMLGNGQTYKRAQTLGELMRESLDWSTGPQHEEAMAVLMLAALGNDTKELAAGLLKRMIAKYAEMHGVDDGDE